MSYTYIIKRGDDVWNAQRYKYSRSSLAHTDLENLKKNILDYENVDKTSLNHFAFITPSSAIFHFVPETYGAWTDNVKANANGNAAGHRAISAAKQEVDNSDAKSDTTDGSGGDAIIGLFD